ncbi:hypothetical protein A0J61_11059, partial [Choanephora cucurbitarum]
MKEMNRTAQLTKKAFWIEEWTEKVTNYLHNCAFLDELDVDINILSGKAWSAGVKPAIVETESAKAILHTVLGAISSYDVANVAMKEPGYVKRRKLVSA